MFDSNCENLKISQIYIKVYCRDIPISILGLLDISKLNFTYPIIIINFLSIICLIWYLFLSKITETKLAKHFESYKASPMSYALKISNLPNRIPEQEMIKELYSHFLKFWTEILKKSKETFPVIDISVALDNNLYFSQRSIKEIEENITNIYQEIITNPVYASKIKTGKRLDIVSLTTQLKSLPTKGNNINLSTSNHLLLDYDKVKGKLKNMIKLLTKKKEILKAQEKISVRKLRVYNSYITFSTIQDKNIFYKSLKTTTLTKMYIQLCCCLMCFKFDVRRFKGKVLKAIVPSQPINIKWENIQYSKTNKRVRRWIGTLLTFLLFFIRKLSLHFHLPTPPTLQFIYLLIFIALILVTYLSISLKSVDHSTNNCPYNPIVTKEAALTDYTQGRVENLMYCYCTDKFSDRLHE